MPLNGADFAYTITFTKDQIPPASRFWSVTAYTPGAIELVPNPINKYVVASYTPGFVANSDGTMTIRAQAEAPGDGQIANWLPVPKGPFSLMLRIYGPEGSAAFGPNGELPTYVAPPIHRTFIR